MEDSKIVFDTFENIVRRTSSYIFSLSYRLTGSYDEANDLLQETFLKAWKNLDLLKDKQKVIPWLRKICVNQYIDSYRKTQREHFINDPVFPHMEYNIVSDAPTPEDELLADEEMRLIHSQCWTIVTRALPLYQQIVLVLIDIYKLNIKETSILIKRSPSATKSLLHRARKAMEGQLIPYCDILNRDNICKCRSWIQFAHDIHRRQEYLKQIAASCINSNKNIKPTKKKLIAVFNNLPQHVPPSKWIEEIIKILQ